VRQPEASISRAWFFGQLGLLAGAYFLAGKLSLLLAIPPGYATALWPPSGIALAAALLAGTRVWPGIWIGAALVNLTVETSLIAAVLIATGNTLEAVAGAALVRRWIGVPRCFERGEDVIKFVVIAAASAIIAATIAMAALVFRHPLSGPEIAWNWLTWWQGDAAGIIIVAPLILSWSVRGTVGWSRLKLLEALCCLLLLLVMARAIFGLAVTGGYPLTIAILPLIIWAAFRFTQREVATAIALVCAVAVWSTLERRGPLALAPLNESLLLLLAFTCIVVITGLTLSAVVAERSRTTLELEKALESVREQAITDPLTGLLNRRYLLEYLPREVIRAQRSGASLAVIMIDLDHFKDVNDRFGHEAGDRVLGAVAMLLKAHIRGSDIACRYGGEEFVFVLPGATLESARRRAEGLRLAIRRLDLKAGDRAIGTLTASFGVALYPEHAVSADALISASDKLLYEAKNSGRDRIVTGAAAAASLIPAPQPAARQP
jgi:diguanylate cyclase (GGDEF)-like protein